MKKPNNYYYEVIPPERAKELRKEGKDIYKLFSDDSETPIKSEKDLYDAIDFGIELAIRKLIT